MAFSPPFFRVATEGATIDGRMIKRAWLEQMAANYQPNLYGARVFIEHIRGMAPDGPFKAYGDVLALKTQEGADGKLALFAQIEPTPDLVALIKARQKIYASVEIDPDFADTKEAYLVGLGITDSPASLGTERLSFARQCATDNIFSAAIEMHTEDTPSILAKVKYLLGLGQAMKTQQEPRFTELNEALETLASHSREQYDALALYQQRLQMLEGKINALTSEQTKDRTAFKTLQQQLATTNDTTPRPAISGSQTAYLTDC